MNGIGDATGARITDGITGFMGTLEYAELLPAKLKHFRHKWHALQATVLIECTEDFFLAPYYNILLRSKLQALCLASSRVTCPDHSCFLAAFQLAFNNCQANASSSGVSIYANKHPRPVQPVENSQSNARIVIWQQGIRWPENVQDQWFCDTRTHSIVREQVKLPKGAVISGPGMASKRKLLLVQLKTFPGGCFKGKAQAGLPIGNLELRHVFDGLP